jgi:UDP-N-acetylmuramoylalanine--D-glutamate ligase
MKAALVYGLAVAGAATVRALQARGVEVMAADDSDAPAKRDLAAELGVGFVVAPDDDELAALVARSDVVVPAPGVPEDHRVVTAAQRRRRRLASEIELAYEWEQQRPGGPRPVLAITGTDGKTTTTLLTVAMLEAAGVRAVAAGNTDVPLVSAVDLDVDAFVVECTSFRLAWTEHFHGTAAAWLNLAPDHLNWHRSLATYAAAKAKIFANQRADDVAIGFVDDAEVIRHLAGAPGRHVTFGLSGADYRVEAATLMSPRGEITPVSSMRRRLPHDVTNGLAAAALVLETGLAGVGAVAAALSTFVGPPHRIELVEEADGIAWFNDSKATTPHAAAAAIGGFDHIVLIAGGRNKGLDLTPMAADPARIRAVVAIGEASDEIGKAFAAAGAPVMAAASMAEAVGVAGAAALPGDVVLLSPGCASFDWYAEGGFEARGDHFRSVVKEYLHGKSGGGE